jgi:hypothetical protein
MNVSAAFVDSSALEHHVDVQSDDSWLVSSESWQWSGNVPSRAGRLAPHSICPIWRIAGQELRSPLVVTVEQADGEVLINSPRLRIWGVGDEIYSALGDFLQTFQNVCDSYENTPSDQMTEDAISYRQQLRSFLPRP